MNQDEMADQIIGVLQSIDRSNGENQEALEEIKRRLEGLKSAQQSLTGKMNSLEIENTDSFTMLLDSNSEMGAELDKKLDRVSHLLKTTEALKGDQFKLREERDQAFKTAITALGSQQTELASVTRSLEKTAQKQQMLRDWKWRNTAVSSMAAAFGGAAIALLMMFLLGHRPYVVEVSPETLEDADRLRTWRERLLDIPEEERNLILDRVYDPENTAPLQQTPKQEKSSKKGKGKSRGKGKRKESRK